MVLMLPMPEPLLTPFPDPPVSQFLSCFLKNSDLFVGDHCDDQRRLDLRLVQETQLPLRVVREPAHVMRLVFHPQVDLHCRLKTGVQVET